MEAGEAAVKWRWTDRVALGCFVGSLLAFVAFNFLVFEAHRWTGEWLEVRGWVVWKHWWKGVMNIDRLEWFGMEALVWAGIHLAVLLVFASPFMVKALASNRLVWWLACVSSALTMIAIGGGLLFFEMSGWGEPFEGIGPGWWALLMTPPVHFCGVLFVRRREKGSGAFQAP